MRISLDERTDSQHVRNTARIPMLAAIVDVGWQLSDLMSHYLDTLVGLSHMCGTSHQVRNAPHQGVMCPKSASL
jgi:hypothetical protein